MLEKTWTTERDLPSVLTEASVRYLQTHVAGHPIQFVGPSAAFGINTHKAIGIPYIIAIMRWAAWPDFLLAASCPAVDGFGHQVGTAYRQWVGFEPPGTSARAVGLEALVLLTDGTMLSRLIAAGPGPGTVSERAPDRVLIRPGGMRDARLL